jgi:hypothetical protein
MFDGHEENLGRFGRRRKFLDFQMVDLRRVPTGITLVEGWRAARHNR